MHFVLRRVFAAPFVLLALVTATFFLVRLAPGGPFSDERALPEEVERALNERYSLDRPLHVQYGLFLKGIMCGDLGPSLKHRGKSVNEIIARHLPISMQVGIPALVIAVTTGCAAGLLSALRPRSMIDYVVTGTAVLGISIPAFVAGPLIQTLFAVKWGVLPISGVGGVSHVVLPAVALALPFTARFARLTRAGMLEVLTEPYIRTARARGASEFAVVTRHALRGGLAPVAGFLGPAAASIITGSLVVEKVFSIPGLGREFIESALNRDYTLVMGTVIVYGCMIIVGNLLCDLLYAWMDPRVRDAEGGGK